MGDGTINENDVAIMSILDLPDLALACIASFLSYDDICNFKLVCQSFNQSTYSRQGMIRFQINLKPFMKTKNKYLCAFLQKLNFGRMICLKLSKSIQEGSFFAEPYSELFRIYFKDLKELKVINFSLLQIVSTHCKFIDHLSLGCIDSSIEIFPGYLTPTIFDGYGNLKTLQLEAVEIKGVHLLAIIKLPLLKKCHFLEIYVQVENETVLALQESVTNAINITEWYFDGCVIKNKKESVVLNLPPTVYSLYYVGKVSDCCLLYHPESLVELVTDVPLMPPSLTEQYYSNLQILELRGVDFRLHKKLPTCRFIRKLKFQSTWNSILFLEYLLQLGADNLSCLTLDIYPYDYGLADIISEFKCIKCLELIDSTFDDILSFLDLIKQCKPKSLFYVILVKNSEPNRKEYICL